MYSTVMLSFAHIRTAAVWAVLSIVASTSLSGQRSTFQQYGSREGLTNLSILCLLQDKSGYLWVGTENGLFRYDGDRFRAFSHGDGLPSAEIMGLAESPEGQLWVAGQGGVARREGMQFKTVDTGEQGGVRNVAFDSLGRVYLEYSSGIVRGVPEKEGKYHFEKVAQGAVRGLYVKGEEVWFGRDGDLWRLAREKQERVGSVAGLPVDLWGSVAQDTLGNLWIRSSTQLYELPRGQARFVNRSSGIPNGSLIRLYADRHGRLFVSSDSGVVVLDGDKRIQIDSQHGLPADAMGAILLDREESLWLGAYGGGLIRRLGHGEWQSWQKEDGLLHNHIWAIRRDNTGQVWVGSSGGLNILGPDGRVAHSFTSHNGLAGDRVLSIAEGPNGDFFVATDPPGISRFSKQGVLLQTYGSASKLAGDYLLTIAFDRQRQLWVGGTRGCFRSQPLLASTDELKFERVYIPGVAAETGVYQFLVDQSGVVWLATSHGLARFDGKNWKVFTQADGLKADQLSAIAEGQGALWLVYRDAAGISRMQFDGERHTVAHFTMHEGLSSNQAIAVAFDTSGSLWVTTDNGVDVYARGHWLHYGLDDGLIWEDTNGGALHADAKGNVWVGTSKGLSRYATSPYSMADSAPAVVLTSIEGISREFQAGEQPILPYSQSSLLIRFSSLNYAYETRTRFRYRLLGYEDRWNETSAKNVHFAELPAGHYVFEVVASGPDGLWSPVPAKFGFFIRPPWWHSWWFVATCLLMALFVGRALWQLRVRALVAQKELLVQQVAERTAELRKSKQQLWAAMDAAKLGIWSQNLAGGENSGAELIQSIFSAGAGEIITLEDLLRFVVPEDRERFERIVTQRNQQQDDSDSTLEYRVILPDGTILWLQVRGGVLHDDSAGAKRAAGVVMDITEQKRAEQDVQALEQQLRQAQKIEAVGRLAGGIAHDFNNLLMVIQSYTEMLQDSLPENDSLRNNTEQVLKAADRGASLTKQLLAFSRKQVLSPAVLDLNAVVGEGAEMLKRLIGENIELRVNSAESLGAVRADPNQLAQVLVNLCVNARDAMPQGGTLTIETRNFTMNEHLLGKYPYVRLGNYVLLSVSDTGTGISRDVQEQMFEPFFTTKERGKGTGLGLPTVFGIVKQSGGYVWVDSELGQGASFTICLPRVKGVLDSDTPAKPEYRQRGTGTILVAEDEDALRDAMRDYLRSLGYTVLAASSGPNALSVASQYEGHIDLLITDVVMPKMNGGELSQALGSLRPHLKTMYMSGYTDDAAVRYCVREEGVAFLQKPFSLAALARKVYDMLGATAVSHSVPGRG
jgi:PAS domain S-box-containing protein